jgi:hypothetical protein
LTLRSTITSPGKVIMLEMKVPEVTATGRTLSISTDQLQRYLGRRLPVFYVLPVPHWPGPLRPGASDPASPAGWWRRRSDPYWFGNWTYVLSAAGVASRVNMTAANPVLYTIPTGAAGSSSLPKALKDAHSWPRFWSEIQSCGPIGAIRWRIREIHMAPAPLLTWLAKSCPPWWIWLAKSCPPWWIWQIGTLVCKLAG